MSVCVILNLLNEMNGSILCDPLVSMMLFYLINSINLVMNQHKLDFYLSHTSIKRTINFKQRSFFTYTPIM